MVRNQTDLYEKVGHQEYWDGLFQRPDPFDYDSAYERAKYLQTLGLVPESASGLELACAEGHFTKMLASRIPKLVATDISKVALDRAIARCSGQSNVSFQVLDFEKAPILEDFDLIVCSEVLYYMGTVDRLSGVARKLSDAIVPGGHLLLTHANLVSDDPEQSGFDWEGHTFGAKTIGEVFSRVPGLQLRKELRTPLYRIQLFQKAGNEAVKTAAPEIIEAPLEARLTPAVEKHVVWGGTVIRRSEAERLEETSQVPILMYHRIAEDGPGDLAPYRTSPQLFEQQLNWLCRHGYRSITIDEWTASHREHRALPGRPILITFDDGYLDFATTAWPILERRGFSATVFVVTDRVGGAADWDSSFGSPARLMDWDQIQELARQGVNFGSHTGTHRRLTEISLEEVVEEALTSRTSLESKIGKDVTSFSYPWGQYNLNIQSTVADCGYGEGFTTQPGFSSFDDNLMALPRIEIFGYDDVESFSKKLKYS